MAARRLRLVTERLAHAPPDVVWSTFTDVDRWPAFSPVVEAVHAVPARWEAGERLAFTLRIGGARVPFDVRLDEVVPGRLVRWSSVRWTVTGTRTHTFTPADGGTHVADEKVFTHAWWPLGVLYPRGTIRRLSADWVADLAAEAERRAT